MACISALLVTGVGQVWQPLLFENGPSISQSHGGLACWDHLTMSNGLDALRPFLVGELCGKSLGLPSNFFPDLPAVGSFVCDVEADIGLSVAWVAPGFALSLVDARELCALSLSSHFCYPIDTLRWLIATILLPKSATAGIEAQHATKYNACIFNGGQILTTSCNVLCNVFVISRSGVRVSMLAPRISRG
ncbi:hypothetical protein NY78_4276 [Desulfovibrio sp. TomC]|nr:hypothetical protein NY78_4276 [Desulfovibrio sp. TomC]